jgi:hypothetical protein
MTVGVAAKVNWSEKVPSDVTVAVPVLEQLLPAPFEIAELQLKTAVVPGSEPAPPVTIPNVMEVPAAVGVYTWRFVSVVQLGGMTA